MKIAIDARYIKTSSDEVLPSGGIGRYTYNLICQLNKISPELELVLVVPEGNGRPIIEDSSSSIKEVCCPGRPHSLRTQFFLTRRIDLSGVELFHSPFNMLPAFLQCKGVVTIHDVMWATNPELCARFLPERLWIGVRYRFAINFALRKADHVLTISQASRAAIDAYRPNSGKKTTAIHHGVESGFCKMPDHECWKEIDGLVPIGSRFVLCLGQGSPYKNHDRALLSFAEAFQDRPDMKLVFVRRFKRPDYKVMRQLMSRKLQGKVIALASVSDSQVRALYNLARIFFFPSLAEGFGMPLLEAMACGCPVLTSNTSVLPEIVGDSALLTDPYNVGAMAGSLLRLETDEELRQSLIAKGKKRVNQFKWEQCARETLGVYRNICKVEQKN